MRPRKLSILLILLILTIFISCKKKRLNQENYLPYYHKINEASYLEYKKIFLAADSLYNLSLNLVERPFYEDCFKAAKNALHISNTKTYYYLEKGIEHGLKLETIKGDSLFTNFLLTNHWQLIQKNYNKKRLHYESFLNVELGEELESMFTLDQAVRTNPEKFNMTMMEIDELNMNKLICIIEEFGYPGFSVVGEEIGRKFPVMFHHFSLDNNEVHFNHILNREMMKGEISPFRNAIFRDYNRICKGMKTLYGMHYSTEGKEKIFYLVEDYSKINERRYKMGLEPIEQFLEKENIKYDSN